VAHYISKCQKSERLPHNMSAHMFPCINVKTMDMQLQSHIKQKLTKQ